MQILFRADGGHIRGSGHLVRCLTLADRMARDGHTVTFISRADAGALLDILKSRSYQLLILPEPACPPVQAEEIWTEVQQQEDWALCYQALNGQTFDWIVVDHYGLNSVWEKLARLATSHLAAIDDLANRAHDCDLLIDQNEYTGKETRYTRLLPPGACLVAGAAYALLREEFVKARPNLAACRPVVKNILILMGSSDFHGQTLRLLNILRPLATTYGFHVHLVIGQNNAQREHITALTAHDPSFSVHTNHQKISDLMLQADLAFGAGGTATWEFCSLGVPLLLISFAQNQIALARDAAACGIADYLGHYDKITDAEIAQQAEDVIKSFERRAQLHKNSIEIVNAEGADRAYQAILKLSILSLRPIRQDDSRDLYRWRNDPQTRQMSLSTLPVSEEDHDQWLSASLNNPQRILIIAEADAKIGVIRFDVNEQEALVSLNLNPAFRGQGYASLLLQKAEAFLKRDVKELKAQIKPDNAASLAAFTKAGYIPASQNSHVLTYLKKLPYNANSIAEGIHDPDH